MHLLFFFPGMTLESRQLPVLARHKCGNRLAERDLTPCNNEPPYSRDPALHSRET